MNPFVNRAARGLILALLLLLAIPAVAQPTFEFMGDFFVHSLSMDGTKAAGLTTDGSYETCRWSADSGIQLLGMNAAVIVGRSAGTPGISYDGTRIGATIATSDSLYVTGGRWTQGARWEEVMPPIPPDGGVIDESLASAWGLSGDGETVVGLYWRPGQSDGVAHAYAWTSDGGLLGLGGLGAGSRANGVNYDGSIVVGYAKNIDNHLIPAPTVWEIGDGGNFTLTPLSDTEGGELRTTNSDGTVLAGNIFRYADGRMHGALWFDNGPGWDEVDLGYLPGSGPNYGEPIPLSISDDASIMVGTHRMSINAFIGFIWTLAEGMMTIEDFFTAYDVPAPVDFDILSVSAITPGGNIFAGYGFDHSAPGSPIRSFMVNLNPVSSVPGAVANRSLQLGPAFPNPFNPSTSFRLTMGNGGPVKVDLFDARGRLVRVLQDGQLGAGSHVLHWDGTTNSGGRAASGVYLARARSADGSTSTQRMMLVK